MVSERQREWVEWGGGELAPYEGEVVVLFRNRKTDFGEAHTFEWLHDGNEYDIIAWRPSNTSALDVQIGGEHYKSLAIQPVEFITKNKLGFLEGCVIKRICRFRDKNGREDLEKIKHEIDLLIELEYGKQA